MTIVFALIIMWFGYIWWMNWGRHFIKVRHDGWRVWNMRASVIPKQDRRWP